MLEIYPYADNQQPHAGSTEGADRRAPVEAVAAADGAHPAGWQGIFPKSSLSGCARVCECDVYVARFTKPAVLCPKDNRSDNSKMQAFNASTPSAVASLTHEWSASNAEASEVFQMAHCIRKSVGVVSSPATQSVLLTCCPRTAHQCATAEVVSTTHLNTTVAVNSI